MVILGQRWEEEGISEVIPAENTGVLGTDNDDKQETTVLFLFSQSSWVIHFITGSPGKRPYVCCSLLHPASNYNYPAQPSCSLSTPQPTFTHLIHLLSSKAPLEPDSHCYWFPQQSTTWGKIVTSFRKHLLYQVNTTWAVGTSSKSSPLSGMLEYYIIWRCLWC